MNEHENRQNESYRLKAKAHDILNFNFVSANIVYAQYDFTPCRYTDRNKKSQPLFFWFDFIKTNQTVQFGL